MINVASLTEVNVVVLGAEISILRRSETSPSSSSTHPIYFQSGGELVIEPVLVGRRNGRAGHRMRDEYKSRRTMYVAASDEPCLARQPTQQHDEPCRRLGDEVPSRHRGSSQMLAQTSLVREDLVTESRLWPAGPCHRASVGKQSQGSGTNV